MSKTSPRASRDAYLAALPVADELAVRHAAEEHGLGADDYTWVFMDAQRRASETVAVAVAAAADRIEQAARRAETAVEDDGIEHAAKIAEATAQALAHHPPILASLNGAIGLVRDDALDALHEVRTAIRRHARAPARSLLFSFILGAVALSLVIWGTYHVAFDYGQHVGYEAGFYDATRHIQHHH